MSTDSMTAEGQQAELATSKIELTERDIELVLQALREHRHGLSGYTAWVNDRPQLPAAQVAIDRIEAEVREIAGLEVRFYDFRKARAALPHP